MFTTVEPVLPPGFRLPGDAMLKTMNLVIVVGLVGCLVGTLTDVALRADKTVNGFWYSSGDFKLSSRFEHAFVRTQNCGHTVTLSMGNYDLDRFVIDGNTRLPLMAQAAGLIRRGLFVSCATAFVGILNRILFNYNIHEVEIAGWIAPKSYLVLLEICGIIWSIVALAHPEDLNSNLTSYIKACTSSVNYKGHLFEATPFIAMFVMWGLVLFSYLINLLVLFHNSSKELPISMRAEWHQIKALLATLPKNSPVLAEIEDSMRREIEGDGPRPFGIKHLLAHERNMFPPEVAEVMAGNLAEEDEAAALEAAPAINTSHVSQVSHSRP